MHFDANEAAIVAILLSSIGYAIWLSVNGNSRFGGKRWADDHTWVTVVIGVSMVLFWGGLVDGWTSAELWFWRFAAGGIPMVVRSLLLER
ncbi:MAG: hypothetical protein KDE20_18895 [Caldilineaceae bacterium]|nr:hypothetical protein [Caldilineaceae bacterium]MCB0156736.1 hypothetical protein [Caldilineaceae bacterium]MCB9161652.1 hypothetical protein [Caldilineaceae bacterium]